MSDKSSEYKIRLQYFKENGSYYSEGEYMTNKEFMWEIFNEVRQMKESNNLPDINGTYWNVYVDASEHPNGFPGLV